MGKLLLFAHQSVALWEPLAPTLLASLRKPVAALVLVLFSRRSAATDDAPAAVTVLPSGITVLPVTVSLHLLGFPSRHGLAAALERLLVLSALSLS